MRGVIGMGGWVDVWDGFVFYVIILLRDIDGGGVWKVLLFVFGRFDFVWYGGG